MSHKNYILAIESSCDDTGAAVILDRKILSNIVADQEIHRIYGGVVPELASRAHQKNIIPVVDAALKRAEISVEDLKAIAFTRGPGLMGSLLVGSSFAKSLSLALAIPLIEVNHLQAHILAHFIEDANNKAPNFPFLCLTVSGGHTQIVQVNDYLEMKLLGKAIDDAAGEAFDKIGKLLGLDYPAGPLIDQLARDGDENKFTFTKPRVKDLDFSFSGLKTAVMYFLQKETQKVPNFIQENLNDLCASVQKTIVDILIEKLEKASLETEIKEIAIAGGVSANSELRKRLKEKEETLKWKTYIPKLEYTTDNAAMIAIVGEIKYNKNQFTSKSVNSVAKYNL